MNNTLAILLISTITFSACGQNNPAATNKQSTKMNNKDLSKLQIATFGGGCFWCTEAVFQLMNGVDTVVSGYSGGKIENPTYKQISTGTTGHAEVIQIYFNPEIVSYEELLEVFFNTHDPTTLNRQGNDVGTQYRSVIFYHSEKQKEIAEAYKQQIEQSGTFSNPIVTEISALQKFYIAEDYHQNYYNLNSNQSYCAYVVRPKVDKFKKLYKDKMK
jgi:peptide-methionine (S)-S-oxide reductase